MCSAPQWVALSSPTGNSLDGALAPIAQLCSPHRPPTPPIHPRDQESNFQTLLCHETSGTMNKYLPVPRPQLKQDWEGPPLRTAVRTWETVHETTAPRTSCKVLGSKGRPAPEQLWERSSICQYRFSNSRFHCFQEVSPDERQRAPRAERPDGAQPQLWGPGQAS